MQHISAKLLTLALMPLHSNCPAQETSNGIFDEKSTEKKINTELERN